MTRAAIEELSRCLQSCSYTEITQMKKQFSERQELAAIPRAVAPKMERAMFWFDNAEKQSQHKFLRFGREPTSFSMTVAGVCLEHVAPAGAKTWKDLSNELAGPRAGVAGGSRRLEFNRGIELLIFKVISKKIVSLITITPPHLCFNLLAPDLHPDPSLASAAPRGQPSARPPAPRPAILEPPMLPQGRSFQ